jgi:transposase InsO family protein
MSASGRASLSTSTSKSSAGSAPLAIASAVIAASPSRGAGWQYVFAAIDDATRLGFARIYPDESADSALAFLAELERFYSNHAITVERVLTDNGTCFKRRWQLACEQRRIGVRKTRPYRPQTNGKVERFIRTLLELWAYAYPYQHEQQRAAALPPALDSYNRYRRHRALGGLTPLQRVNNLSGTNS